MCEIASAIRVPRTSSGARLKGRARGALICAVFGSAWMFWAAAFAPRFVGVGHRDDGLNRRTGGDARSNSSALCGLRRRPRTMGFNRPSVLDRHGCGVRPGGGRGDRTRSLPPLLANTPVPGSHYRIAFSRSRRLLRAPRYYIMGTAMILCALASVLVPEGEIRNVIACAGIGLPMWVTAVVILSQD